MMTTTKADIAIVGGGLTGLALARALRDSPYSIVLLDKTPAPTSLTGRHTPSFEAPHFDDRSLAISESSRRLLSALDIWSAIEHEASPIRQIHISDRGHFGRCQLRAEEHGVSAFGHVVELRVLGQALWHSVQNQANLTVLSSTEVTHIESCALVPNEQPPNEPSDSGARLHFSSVNAATPSATDAVAQCLQAQVVLAADGGLSRLRGMDGLHAETFDYQQTALIANIETELAHAGRAYERFTPTGPLALLPLTRQRMSLVWTLNAEEAKRLAVAQESDFLQELQRAFGWRLGKLGKVGARTTFPLLRVSAHCRRQGQILLMGNASATLHPIAGQGFNLALRDLMALAAHVQMPSNEQALSAASLARFVDERALDTRHVIATTHNLVQLFSNDHPLLSGLRALSLSALDSMPVLKRYAATQAMGFR